MQGTNIMTGTLYSWFCIICMDTVNLQLCKSVLLMKASLVSPLDAQTKAHTHLTKSPSPIEGIFYWYHYTIPKYKIPCTLSKDV